MNVKRLAAAERQDLADFLDTLSPADWQAQTLCDDWTVHQLVAHVISYDELGPAKLVGRFVKGWMSSGDSNSVGVEEYVKRTPEELVALLRAHLVPRGVTAGFGGAIGLTDALIHHQDMRRPLKLPRLVPPDRVAAALRMALRAPPLPARQNAKGLRLEATDLDWSAGSGPEVTGPGEAILMAIAGRADALSDLQGSGLSTLTERVVAS